MSQNIPRTDYVIYIYTRNPINVGFWISLPTSRPDCFFRLFQTFLSTLGYFNKQPTLITNTSKLECKSLIV